MRIICSASPAVSLWGPATPFVLFLILVLLKFRCVKHDVDDNRKAWIPLHFLQCYTWAKQGNPITLKLINIISDGWDTRGPVCRLRAEQRWILLGIWIGIGIGININCNFVAYRIGRLDHFHLKNIQEQNSKNPKRPVQLWTQEITKICEVLFFQRRASPQMHTIAHHWPFSSRSLSQQLWQPPLSRRQQVGDEYSIDRPDINIDYNC